MTTRQPLNCIFTGKECRVVVSVGGEGLEMGYNICFKSGILIDLLIISVRQEQTMPGFRNCLTKPLSKLWPLALMALAAPGWGVAADWTLSYTADGQPDIEGIWSNATQTRLERAADLGDKRSFTNAEAAVLEARVKVGMERSMAPSDANRAPPADGNVASAYNSFWLERGSNVTLIDGEYRTSMIVEPSNGQIPWLPIDERRPSQLSRWLAMPGVEPFDGPELQTIGERCLLFWDFRTSNSSAGPPMMPMIYNNNYQIVQSPGYVLIYAEMMHDARIVRLDAQHRAPHMVQWMGDSVGHWEEDTLVVVTKNMHPQQSHFGSSENITITERFQRTGEDDIVYSFTMDDPSVYREPWKAQMQMKQRPEDRIYEYACHEGNYALSGILGGARVQERESSEGTQADR